MSATLPAVVAAEPPPPPVNPTAELLDDFLAGLRESSRQAYAKDFRAFARFASGDEEPDVHDVIEFLLSLDAGDANHAVLVWRDAMLAANVATATIARRLAALRSVVKLARTLGRVSWSIEIKAPKVEGRRDVRGPDKTEWDKLWRAAKALGDTLKGRRDRAILSLLYDLALRRNEVCALDRADVDLGAKTVAVLRKGHREKVLLTMPLVTSRFVADWLFVRVDADGPLFYGLDHRSAARKLERISGEGVALICRRLGTAAGIGRRVRPHGLRHAAITRALDLKHDIRDVRKFSGHASLNTVLKYDDARDDVAVRIARQVAGDRR